MKQESSEVGFGFSLILTNFPDFKSPDGVACPGFSILLFKICFD